MQREHNWADTYTFRATHIVHPTSVDEARHIVAAGTSIRALGTRHSFNGIADCADTLINLGAIDPDFALDRDRGTATVGAATQYGVLAGWLQWQGYALHNLGSLPHISVAGAIATGTHGSGDANGNLSSAVSGLELILADGSIRAIRRGGRDFEGMVVGLGALGVITRVTLDVQPTFDVRQDAFVDLPWDRLLSDLDAITSAAYSVSIFTMWSTEIVGRLWLKTRLLDALPREVTATHLGARSGPARLVSSATADPTDRLNPFDGLPGPWSSRLPHSGSIASRATARRSRASIWCRARRRSRRCLRCGPWAGRSTRICAHRRSARWRLTRCG